MSCITRANLYWQGSRLKACNSNHIEISEKDKKVTDLSAVYNLNDFTALE